MMAAGHRRRRREASLTAVSTVPNLNEAGLAFHDRVSASRRRQSDHSSFSRWPAEVMVLSEVDARSPHHGFQGAVTPQCEDANCSANVVPANNA
jgi:hypothetical protein